MCWCAFCAAQAERGEKRRHVVAWRQAEGELMRFSSLEFCEFSVRSTVRASFISVVRERRAIAKAIDHNHHFSLGLIILPLKAFQTTLSHC